MVNEEIRIISARKASSRERAFTTPVTDKQRGELQRLAARPIRRSILPMLLKGFRGRPRLRSGGSTGQSSSS
jgi:hypothetical protein